MEDNNNVVLSIEEHKKLEDLLARSELRFRTLFETSADAIMTLEPPTWSFTVGNPAALKMFMAKSQSEFTSTEPWKLSPEFQPDGRPSGEKAKEMIETAMQGGSHFFEWTHRRLSGEDFPATVLLTRVTLGDKDFLQATVRDITEQKRTEDKLVASESRYRLLTEISPDCIKLFDLEGNLLFINKGGREEHLLKSDEDVKNFKPINTIFSEDKQKFFAAFENAKKGIGSVVEVRHTKEGSDRDVCSEMMEPVLDGAGNVVSIFAVSRDLSDTKRSEEELATKMADMEKLNRFMIGREVKMVELKKEIADCKAKLQNP